jgi:hypothetical protein
MVDTHLSHNDKRHTVIDDWTGDKYEIVRADFELRLKKL